MVYMVYSVAYIAYSMAYMVHMCVGYQASRTALCLQNAGKQQQQQSCSFVVVFTNKSFDLRKLRPR